MAITRQALTHMETIIGTGSDSVIPHMAGRAEEGLGDPEIVAESTYALYQDLITALEPAR